MKQLFNLGRNFRPIIVLVIFSIQHIGLCGFGALVKTSDWLTLLSFFGPYWVKGKLALL